MIRSKYSQLSRYITSLQVISQNTFLLLASLLQHNENLLHCRSFARKLFYMIIYPPFEVYLFNWENAFFSSSYEGTDHHFENYPLTHYAKISLESQLYLWKKRDLRESFLDVFRRGKSKTNKVVFLTCRQKWSRNMSNYVRIYVWKQM